MRETVLVVDDDDDVRSLYRGILKQRGYKVLEAASLEDAFGMLAYGPHVIVLDLELPDGKSTALLDALARDAEAPPVVLCSSSVQGAKVARRYHISALGKFALTDIANEVDRALRTGVRPRVSGNSARGRESAPSFA